MFLPHDPHVELTDEGLRRRAVTPTVTKASAGTDRPRSRSCPTDSASSTTPAALSNIEDVPLSPKRKYHFVRLDERRQAARQQATNELGPARGTSLAALLTANTRELVFLVVVFSLALAPRWLTVGACVVALGSLLLSMVVVEKEDV